MLVRIAGAAEIAHYGGMFSSWPSLWTPIPSLNDPDDGLPRAQLELVGDSSDYGVFYSVSPGYIFFRVRVQYPNPVVAGTTFDDTIMIVVDVLDYVYPVIGEVDKPDFGFAWDSQSADQTKHGLELMIPSSLGSQWSNLRMGDIDGKNADKDAPPDFGTMNGDGYIRTIDGITTANFGTTTFVDFAINRSFLTNSAPGLATNTLWRVQIGTINNANDHNFLDYDIAGNNSGGSIVTNSWSDPINSTNSAAPPTLLYINNQWTTGSVDGDLELAGTQTATVGTDAFASPAAALAAYPTYSGPITFNGGTYTSALLAGGGNVTLNLVRDLLNGEDDVTLQNLTGDAGDSIVTRYYGVAGGNLTVEQGTFSGVISGAGDLTKTTSGTLTLSGINTYSGSTTVSGGTLKLAGANIIPDGSAVTVASAGTLSLTGSSETIGSLAGGGIVTNTGAVATLTAGGNNTSTTFSGQIVGDINLTKSGTGILTVSGINTYTGSTTVNNGWLQLSGGSDRLPITTTLALTGGSSTGLDMNGWDQTVSGLTGSGDVVNGGASAATLTVSNDVNNAYAGTISGNIALTKDGAGQLTISGANTHSGVTTINSGQLIFANPLAAQLSTVSNNVDGGIQFENIGTATFGGLAGSGDFGLTNLAGNAVALDVGSNNSSTQYSGDISGSGSLTKSGTGRLTMSGDNTYSGVTLINSGTLQIGTGGTSGSISGVISNNATLVFSRSDEYTYTNVVSGTGSLIKEGVGRLTLTGTNTYSGTTTINKGILELAGDGQINNSSGVSINGGTLKVDSSIALSSPVTFTANGGTLTGSGTLSSAMTLGYNAVLAPGYSMPDTLTFGSDLTWTDGGKYLWEINDWTGTQGIDPGWDFVDVAGSLDLSSLNTGGFTIDATSLTLGNVVGDVANFSRLTTNLSFNILYAATGITGFSATDFVVLNHVSGAPGTWSLVQDGNYLQLRWTWAVPEPGVTVLLGVGLITLMIGTRMRKAGAQQLKPLAQDAPTHAIDSRTPWNSLPQPVEVDERKFWLRAKYDLLFHTPEG